MFYFLFIFIPEFKHPEIPRDEKLNSTVRIHQIERKLYRRIMIAASKQTIPRTGGDLIRLLTFFLSEKDSVGFELL